MSLNFVLLKMGACVKVGDLEGLNTSAHLPSAKESSLSRNTMQQMKTNGSFIIYSFDKTRFHFSIIKMLLLLLQATWSLSCCLHKLPRRCQPFLARCMFWEGSICLCSLSKAPRVSGQGKGAVQDAGNVHMGRKTGAQDGLG